MVWMFGTIISSRSSWGVYCVAILPEALSMIYASLPFQTPRSAGFNDIKSTEVGSLKNSCHLLKIISLINSFHNGATIYPATFFSIGVLSLLPAHAPIATDGVYPIIQASL